MSNLDFSNDDAASGLPTGYHNMRICDAKVAKNKKDRDMLTIEFGMAGDKYKNMTVKGYYVLEGPEDWIKSHRGEVSDILDKVGLGRSLDTDGLKNKVISVKLGENKDGYLAIRGYKKAEVKDEY